MFRLYSCSKIFTASALMFLLERGLIGLDDPVSEFLPEYKHAVYCRYTGNNMESYQPVSSLTLRHLVTAISYMHQLMPDNMEGYCHPRIKNAVNGQLL